jgi:hypothetical protein
MHTVTISNKNPLIAAKNRVLTFQNEDDAKAQYERWRKWLNGCGTSIDGNTWKSQGEDGYIITWQHRSTFNETWAHISRELFKLKYPTLCKSYI